MADEIQNRIREVKRIVTDDEDDRSVMSDMIKEDDISETGSIKSVSTSRFRILPNPRKFFGGKGGGNISSGGGRIARTDDNTDKGSVRSGSSANSIFSKFGMKDSQTNPPNAYEPSSSSSSSFQNQQQEHNPALFVNDLSKVNTSGGIIDRDREYIQHERTNENNNNYGVNDQDLNISLTRKDSNESILSTMSTWSNFGFHIFGGGADDSESVSHTGHPHSHSNAHTYNQTDNNSGAALNTDESVDNDEDDKKSTYSQRSEKSKFSSSSFSKMKKKMVKFFIKDPRDNVIEGKRRDSNSSILSVDALSELNSYNENHEESIKTLMALGFDRQTVISALVASNNNVSDYTYLFMISTHL